MSDIINAIRNAHAEHDPHGFKSQGANSPKHGHVNEPYQFQAFPKMVYRGKHTKIVKDATEHDAAIADGWSEEVPEAGQE